MEPGPPTPLWIPGTLRPYPKCPLPQGDALITYKNIKREKSWGREGKWTWNEVWYKCTKCVMQWKETELQSIRDGNELSTLTLNSGCGMWQWQRCCSFSRWRNPYAEWDVWACPWSFGRALEWLVFNGPIHWVPNCFKNVNRRGAGGFGIGVVGKYVFTGYVGGCCLWRVNQRGACE